MLTQENIFFIDTSVYIGAIVPVYTTHSLSMNDIILVSDNSIMLLS